jgi:hypothetical protein
MRPSPALMRTLKFLVQQAFEGLCDSCLTTMAIGRRYQRSEAQELWNALLRREKDPIPFSRY